MRSRHLFYSGCAIMAVAASLVVKSSLREQDDRSVARDSTSESQAAVQKPLGTPILSALLFDSAPEEAPLSADARMLLAELTATIEQGESGRILTDKFCEAGARASDFLDLASMIKARTSELELGSWNLEVVLGAAATIDGQAAAKWYDRNVSSDFLEQHEWVGRSTLFLTVAIDWLRFEPRQAIRWAAKHEHLSVGANADWNLDQIVVYWPESDFAGQIDWIEEQTRAGSGLVTRLGPAVRYWAREDPAAAVNWMESFAENEISSLWVRQRGYEDLAKGWGQDRLAEVVEWLTTLPPGDVGLDAARRFVAGRLTKSDPVGAIDVAQDIGDRPGSNRLQLIIDAARNLYRSDPEIVVEWLPESGLSEEVQLSILLPEN